MNGLTFGRKFWYFGVVAVVLYLGGCATYAPIQDSNRQLLRSGNYQAALVALDNSSLAKSGTNELLYLFERGHLQHLSGDYEASNTTLNEAEYLAEDLFTKSVSRGLGSFLTNDNVIPYAGEDYESALIHYYKALNYIALGNLESASVESRKVDEKLNYFFDSYDGKNVYKEDAFLRLLTGLIYEADGDVNNAFIAYRKSLEAYRYFADKYQMNVPEILWHRLVSAARLLSFTEEYNQFKQEAKDAGVEPVESASFLVVIADIGTLPAKREVSVQFPTDKGFPVKLAMPTFENGAYVPDLQVMVDGKMYDGDEVESVSAIARQSLEDKKGRVLAKTIARAVAKELVAREAEKKYGVWAGLAARAAASVSEQADIRLWSTLPAEIEASIIPLPVGSYQVMAKAGSVEVNRAIEMKHRPVEFIFFRAF